MRPACRFLNAPVFVKLVESSVGISLQRAAELPQVPLGVLAFAIRRIGKPHGGRGLISCRTIIANIRPQPPRLGLAVADRKSTRLNSSHANISYAVFCLKKKKNNIF